MKADLCKTCHCKKLQTFEIVQHDNFHLYLYLYKNIQEMLENAITLQNGSGSGLSLQLDQ